MKKICTLLMSVVISFLLCLAPVNAQADLMITNKHSYDTSNFLNCYTTGTVTHGTQVSTWTRTESDTQKWYMYGEDSGRYSLRPKQRPALALNANRSYVGTVANVINIDGNNPNDYKLTSCPQIGQAGRPIGLAPRGAFTRTAWLTANGYKQMCTWEYESDNGYWLAWYY